MKNKFMKIYENISKQILDGRLIAGDMLPSENELAESHSASRETIRKALKMLSEDGYIHKVQGKGSIVLEMKRLDFPVSGLVSFKELTQKMGGRAKTYVETFEKINPSPALQEVLKQTEDELVWKVIRVREIDGERIILDKDFLAEKYVPLLTIDICRKSIYEYLEEDLGLSIGFAKKEITIEEPTKEDRKLLDLEGFHSIVVVKSHVYLDNASLFQFTESRHRPDKFRFVDFARRK
ncbi:MULTISPECIES: trehalose operon repressor [unclassified Peribacillus]|uniref:trehalose operon repressor n=1 Tax=unclassified Peribacillus TaxID=2675266 RepID=UPI00191431EB|nr:MULTISPECIES: trehalose operon repressor [unclassified Peribacillus]MBK5444737.1 trehalose operon repressor [Peribacillus sp. TH24]MBK5460559.1 trehalose operon repressor [Peribacillus sp. TH27]MBK5498713.1 trehalose operon repressor [Peribacillus sp. TH14]WMX56177.1 trehalose operon repressor [Peribacillus sp. R9-11]